MAKPLSRWQLKAMIQWKNRKIRKLTRQLRSSHATILRLKAATRAAKAKAKAQAKPQAKTKNKAKAAAKPKALADNANRNRFRPQPRGLPNRPIENWFRIKPDSYVMVDSDGVVHCVADADGVTVF